MGNNVDTTVGIVLVAVVILIAIILICWWFYPDSKKLFDRNAKFIEKLDKLKYQEPTVLRQLDFENGTVIISKGGHYMLGENIVFNPKSEGFTTSQDPNVLGFFAAIVIECDSVILDLNGFCIKQSDDHCLSQRFFAVIELANSPFIPEQGPANFGSTHRPASNVMICNGTIGLTSHHGIHGNSCSNIYLYNLTVKDFEIAGIHLNGVKGLVCEDVTVGPTMSSLKVNSSFSQAVFARRALKIKADTDDSFMSKEINLYSSGHETIIALTGYDIKERLDYAISNPLKFFPLDGNKSDGNVYGMVINSNGVAVDGFPTEIAESEDCSQFCDLINVHIFGIKSKPEEVPALSCDHNQNKYGSIVQKGPYGDVFRVNTDNDDLYLRNPLSDTQLFIATHGTESTTSIQPSVLEWASQSQYSLETISKKNGCGCSFIGGGDSMAHVMKGNIGLFICQSSDFRFNDVTIDDIGNEAKISKIDQAAFGKNGGSSTGLLIAACEKENVNFEGVTVDCVTSAHGEARKIHVKSASGDSKVQKPIKKRGGCPFS